VFDPVHAAIPAFLALLGLEAFAARRRGLRVFEARDTAASLSMGIGSVVIGALWGVAVVAVYLWLYAHRRFELGSGPGVFALALLADDFAYYWFHRLHHEVRVLWAAHVTHHSSRRYNLATALRQSWTPMTALPFYAPLAWLGVDPGLLVAAHGVNLLYQFWIHTELVDRCPRWFEAVFNTPSHHRVHHGANPRYLDRNYGGILILWDRLFGTFEPESEPVRFGLTKDIDSYNPLWIAFHEWSAVIRDAWRAEDPATRLGYLFAPPGWRPDAASRTASEIRREALAGSEALPQTSSWSRTGPNRSGYRPTLSA
jgi:sterol desaturase/sphingolipid hydroxylase (fatty acid hydroxylase superfamily)